jgi:hypothetical protein
MKNGFGDRREAALMLCVQQRLILSNKRMTNSFVGPKIINQMLGEVMTHDVFIFFKSSKRYESIKWILKLVVFI